MTFKEPLWSSKCDPNDKTFYDTQYDHYQEQEDLPYETGNWGYLEELDMLCFYDDDETCEG